MDEQPRMPIEPEAGPCAVPWPDDENGHHVPSHASRLAAALGALLIALPYAAGTVRAETSQVLVVSGGTVGVIEVTLDRTLAAFGDGLTPDGGPTDRGTELVVHRDRSAARAGTCYEWDSAITVSSNGGYLVDARAIGADEALGIMVDAPTTFADCVSGAPLADGEVPLIGSQPMGAERVHTYCLALTVRRDAPQPGVTDEVILEVRPLA